MGYYTTISGIIDYSDVSRANQDIIEKIFDVIDVIQWSCSSSSSSGVTINYYDRENEWLHYFYNVVIDKRHKLIDFDCERKDYNNSTATFLKMIAPYLNPNRVFVIEYNGEDDFYDEDGEENDPISNEITVQGGQVFINKELFITDNKFSFPLPTINHSQRY